MPQAYWSSAIKDLCHLGQTTPAYPLAWPKGLKIQTATVTYDMHPSQGSLAFKWGKRREADMFVVWLLCRGGKNKRPRAPQQYSSDSAISRAPQFKSHSYSFMSFFWQHICLQCQSLAITRTGIILDQCKEWPEVQLGTPYKPRFVPPNNLRGAWTLL